MDYKTIHNSIFNYYKNNLNTYISDINNKEKTIDNFIDGDADILQGGEINFYFLVNQLNILELDNLSNLLEIDVDIVLIFKLKNKNTDSNNVVKNYVSYFFNFNKQNNDLGNIINYNKLQNVDFYDVDEQSQFNTKIVIFKIDYYTEIN
ncbi:MAG: hypothetical protein QXG00_04840 [Candidatus Woesearchaeota archaeon]